MTDLTEAIHAWLTAEPEFVTDFPGGAWLNQAPPGIVFPSVMIERGETHRTELIGVPCWIETIEVKLSVFVEGAATLDWFLLRLDSILFGRHGAGQQALPTFTDPGAQPMYRWGRPGGIVSKIDMAPDGNPVFVGEIMSFWQVARSRP